MRPFFLYDSKMKYNKINQNIKENKLLFAKFK